MEPAAHLPVLKMEDKSDNDSCLCEDLSNKPSVRKGRSASKASSRPTYLGVKSISQTKNPNLEEETKGNNKVKEEDFTSGEDTSGGGEQGNAETTLQDSSVSQHKQGRVRLNIGRSKEISEDLRKQVVESHKNGKGYKRIAKDLELHQSTVRQIVHKWKKFSTVATRPRSGRPTKMSAKARSTIIKYMTENPRVTAKDLKASLALDNINVHESTIRKTLNKWCSWDFTMEETTDLKQE